MPLRLRRCRCARADAAAPAPMPPRLRGCRRMPPRADAAGAARPAKIDVPLHGF